MSQMPASRLEANQRLLKRSLGGTMLPSNIPAETTLWLKDEGQDKKGCDNLIFGLEKISFVVFLLPDFMKRAELVSLGTDGLPNGPEQYFSMKDWLGPFQGQFCCTVPCSLFAVFLANCSLYFFLFIVIVFAKLFFVQCFIVHCSMFLLALLAAHQRYFCRVKNGSYSSFTLGEDHVGLASNERGIFLGLHLGW